METFLRQFYPSTSPSNSPKPFQTSVRPLIPSVSPYNHPYPACNPSCALPTPLKPLQPSLIPLTPPTLLQPLQPLYSWHRTLLESVQPNLSTSIHHIICLARSALFQQVQAFQSASKPSPSPSKVNYIHVPILQFVKPCRTHQAVPTLSNQSK